MSAKKKALESLHARLAEVLLQAIDHGVVEKGEAVPVTAAVLSVARQFLKDNNIEATADNEALNRLGSVTKNLPFSAPDEHGLQ